MFNQSVPGTPDAAEQARQWMRTVVRSKRPDLADRAGQIAGLLVASSVRRSTPDDVIHIVATPTDTGLQIEVRDPGLPVAEDGTEWATVSTLADKFSVSRPASGGRTALAEIHVQRREGAA